MTPFPPASTQENTVFDSGLPSASSPAPSPTLGAQGFTLVELLVGLALLGVLLAVLIPGITGLLGINRTSEQQLNSTTVAQRLIEDVKGAWQITPGMTGAQEAEVKARYGGNCVPGLTTPTGTTVRTTPLDQRAAPTAAAAAAVTESCPATATPPPMRRVTVTVGTGAQATTLTLDVLEPR